MLHAKAFFVSGFQLALLGDDDDGPASEHEFVQWLAHHTVTKAPEGKPFILASDRQSDYFLNIKEVIMTPDFIHYVGNKLARIATASSRAGIHDGYQLICGMETGAIPLVSMVVTLNQTLFVSPKPIEGFYIRKRTNGHGTLRQIEYSKPMTGKGVLLLEDVVTTGGSALEAAKLVRAAGAQFVDIVSVVDREEGAAETFRKEGFRFASLYTGSQLLAVL